MPGLLEKRHSSQKSEELLKPAVAVNTLAIQLMQHRFSPTLSTRLFFAHFGLVTASLDLRVKHSQAGKTVRYGPLLPTFLQHIVDMPSFADYRHKSKNTPREIWWKYFGFLPNILGGLAAQPNSSAYASQLCKRHHNLREHSEARWLRLTSWLGSEMVIRSSCSSPTGSFLHSFHTLAAPKNTFVKAGWLSESHCTKSAMPDVSHNGSLRFRCCGCIALRPGLVSFPVAFPLVCQDI